MHAMAMMCACVWVGNGVCACVSKWRISVRRMESRPMRRKTITLKELIWFLRIFFLSHLTLKRLCLIAINKFCFLCCKDSDDQHFIRLLGPESVVFWSTEKSKDKTKSTHFGPKLDENGFSKTNKKWTQFVKTNGLRLATSMQSSPEPFTALFCRFVLFECRKLGGVAVTLWHLERTSFDRSARAVWAQSTGAQGSRSKEDG